MAAARVRGVLAGVRVLEFGGLAPVPLLGAMLAHAGADVVRLDKPRPDLPDLLGHEGVKRSLAVNLTPQLRATPEARQLLERLLTGWADVVLDPFRPGTLERTVGWSSDALVERNPALVVARLTGYGDERQGGELAPMAGHDINYLAMSGMLSLMERRQERPVPPLNLLGDFGGGSAMAYAGVLSALLHRAQTGRGGVVDASITHGTAYLSTLIYAMRGAGVWDSFGSFLQPGRSPWYEIYKCADERWVAVGAIEPHFYQQLIAGLEGIAAWTPDTVPDAATAMKWQYSRERWPNLGGIIAAAFAGKPQSFWVERYSPRSPFRDACVTPVLTPEEGLTALRMRSWPRGGSPSTDSPPPQPLPHPSPLFYPVMPAEAGHPPRLSQQAELDVEKVAQTRKWRMLEPGSHSVEVLRELRYDEAEVSRILASGLVVQAPPREAAA